MFRFCTMSIKKYVTSPLEKYLNPEHGESAPLLCRIGLHSPKLVKLEATGEAFHVCTRMGCGKNLEDRK